MSTPRRATPARRPDPTRAARLQRDASLERARSVTKGIALGSVAAVAVTGVYLSQALPGHAATSVSSTSGAATPASSPAAASSGGGGTVQTPSNAAPSAPAYTPAPAYQAPVVSSGSS